MEVGVDSWVWSLHRKQT